MRIGELAQQVGVSSDTVRFYERSGWLPRAGRRSNAYRDYGAADVEHLRLLVDLRRLELPLEDAAQVAGWCHAGHCAETDDALPGLIAEQRRRVADRMAGLQVLDDRLASLERHLSRQGVGQRGARTRTPLVMVEGGAPCCDAAEAVIGAADGACACCSTG